MSQLLQLSVVTERDGELPLDPSHPDVEISSITLETWIESRLGDRPNPEP